MLKVSLTVTDEQLIKDLTGVIQWKIKGSVANKDNAEAVAAAEKQSTELIGKVEGLIAAKKVVDALNEILHNVEFIFKGTAREIELHLNSLLSILVKQEASALPSLIKSMLEALAVTENSEKSIIKLQVLSTLFNSIEKTSSLRFDVYKAILSGSQVTGRLNSLDLDFEKLQAWSREWNLTAAQTHELFQSVYDLLKEGRKRNQRHNFFESWISSYESADEATMPIIKDVVKTGIVEAMQSPTIYLFESLLVKKATKMLEGSVLHKLLSIFARGNLDSYEQFYAAHSADIEAFGLSHEQNTSKMRLLTLASIVSGNNSTDIDFATIASTLRLPLEDVENVVIEAVAAKLIEAKIDELNEKVVINHVTSRAFNKQQWEQLYEKLGTWQSSLSDVLDVIRGAKESAQRMLEQRELQLKQGPSQQDVGHGSERSHNNYNKNSGPNRRSQGPGRGGHHGQPQHNQHQQQYQQHHQQIPQQQQQQQQQLPQQMEQNESIGLVPWINVNGEWYVLAQITYASSSYDFKVDSIRCKRRETEPPFRSISRELYENSSQVIDIRSLESMPWQPRAGLLTVQLQFASQEDVYKLTELYDSVRPNLSVKEANDVYGICLVPYSSIKGSQYKIDDIRIAAQIRQAVSAGPDMSAPVIMLTKEGSSYVPEEAPTPAQAEARAKAAVSSNTKAPRSSSWQVSTYHRKETDIWHLRRQHLQKFPQERTKIISFLQEQNYDMTTIREKLKI